MVYLIYSANYIKNDQNKIQKFSPFCNQKKILLTLIILGITGQKISHLIFNINYIRNDQNKKHIVEK